MSSARVIIILGIVLTGYGQPDALIASASSRVCPIFRYEYEVMRVRFWNNCGFPEVEATLGEQGVSRPPRLADRGVHGVAASSGRLSAGSLLGDVASRPCTSDSSLTLRGRFWSSVSGVANA